MIAHPVTLDEAFIDAPPTEPCQFDADRVIDTYQTAQHLRTMRDATPKIAARRGLTMVALEALIMWLDWTFGETRQD